MTARKADSSASALAGLRTAARLSLDTAGGTAAARAGAGYAGGPIQLCRAIPPSTTTFVPVTYAEKRSLRTATAVPAASSGVPDRHEARASDCERCARRKILHRTRI